VVGARPQFVKLGPVGYAVDAYNLQSSREESVEHVVFHTGQHYDLMLSDVFFKEMALPVPARNLGVGSGPHGQQTGRMLDLLERAFREQQPDAVLVYGDTNSTLAAALAAAKLHIPVAHVESGLRSFNKRMPEEINRVLTDHISTFLFCPTRQAVKNAQAEGFTNAVGDGELVPVGDPCGGVRCSADTPVVINVGDVMYDVFLRASDDARAQSGILRRLGLQQGRYALVTVHRSENTDNPVRLRGILEGLRLLAADGLQVVLPMHPRTRNALSSLQTPLDLSDVDVIDPVGYLDMIALEDSAGVILTDSGGVQKEAYFCRVPCVTLRDETEWVELVQAGWNRLAGAEPSAIHRAVRRALDEDQPGDELRLYGDGQAAERVVGALTKWWDCG